MIKVVGQLIPTYAMSCLRLSNSLCDDFTKYISSDILLSSSTNSGKIHWLKWEKLSCPKEKMGLGFQSLEGFNKSLLAKWVWRILQYLNSLPAHTLQVRYFPDSNILNANLGKNIHLFDVVWYEEGSYFYLAFEGE